MQEVHGAVTASRLFRFPSSLLEHGQATHNRKLSSKRRKAETGNSGSELRAILLSLACGRLRSSSRLAMAQVRWNGSSKSRRNKGQRRCWPRFIIRLQSRRHRKAIGPYLKSSLPWLLQRTQLRCTSQGLRLFDGNRKLSIVT